MRLLSGVSRVPIFRQLGTMFRLYKSGTCFRTIRWGRKAVYWSFWNRTRLPVEAERAGSRCSSNRGRPLSGNGIPSMFRFTLAICRTDSLVPVQFRALRAVFLLALALTPIGCAYDPRKFQLPQLMPRHPEVERRAAEYHDPFPDDRLGPGSSTRPPGFSRQRTTTREAFELRGIHMLDSADPLPSTSEAPPKRFSQVVEP
jgi:hypothetical protein